MATHQIPIIGWQAVPDASGQVYLESAATNFGTSDLYPHLVVTYSNSGVDNGVRGVFTVPQNYAGSPAIIVVWSTTASSGQMRMRIDYTAIGQDTAETIDPAADQETVPGTDTAHSTPLRRQILTLALTPGNFAVGDTVLYELFRESGHGDDLLAASVYVFEVLFQYSDT